MGPQGYPVDPLSTDGIGLGLRFVRTIADVHGWSVTAADGNDGGARFEFHDVERADAAKLGVGTAGSP